MQYALIATAAILSVTVGGNERLFEVGGDRIAVFRGAEPFTLTRMENSNPESYQYSASVFSGSWSDQERADIGIFPMISDAEPDSETYENLQSTFEVFAGDRVEEHFTADAKSPEMLAAQLGAIVEGRCMEAEQAESDGRNAGVEYAGKTVQIRFPPFEDWPFITGAAVRARQAIDDQESFSIDFTMADNSDVTLNAAGLLDLFATCFARINGLHGGMKSAKDALRATGAVGDPLTPATYVAKRDAVRAIEIASFFD